MTVSHWQTDFPRPTEEVDVLVVGAGLIGCAAAYFAHEAGHDVTIVDARDMAHGASGRNAGFMITGLDSYYHRAVERYGEAIVREMWDLSKRSIAFWREIVQKAGDVPFEACGSFLLAESKEEAAELAQAAKALESAGFPAIYHDHDPLGRGYYAAIEQPDDGAVQPVALTRALLRLSEARLVSSNPVYAIAQDQPDMVMVYAEKAIYQARYVMLCTNAYSPFLDGYFEGRIIPTRAQCLVTDPLPERVLESVGYSRYGYMYYRCTFDNRFLIGGARDLFTAEEANTSEDRLNPNVQSALDAYMRQYFPDVTVPVTRRWSGIMGFSVDGLPQVGTLPGKPRVAYAVGFTGHGISLGAMTAQRGIDHLLTGANPGAVAAARLD